MHPAIRNTLGIVTIVTIVDGTVAPRTAAGQPAKPDACAFVDAAELRRLTGKKDLFGGPQVMPRDEVPPPHASGCHYVGILFFLDTAITPESFTRVRRGLETRGFFKVQSISGVGDEAYYMWDPKPGNFQAVGVVFRSGSKRVTIAENTPSDSVETMKKLLLSIAKTAATGQGPGPTACSIIDVAELKRLTGRTDILRRGPVPSDPSETPKGLTECEFLGFSFSLASPATKQWFDGTRADQVKQGTKVQPVSGLGDDAYYWWDPRPGTHRQVGIAFRATHEPAGHYGPGVVAIRWRR